jgi:hypothetical protein
MAKNYGESLFVISIPLTILSLPLRRLLLYCLSPASLPMSPADIVVICGCSMMNTAQTALVVHGGKQDVSL